MIEKPSDFPLLTLTTLRWLSTGVPAVSCHLFFVSNTEHTPAVRNYTLLALSSYADCQWLSLTWNHTVTLPFYGCTRHGDTHLYTETLLCRNAILQVTLTMEGSAVTHTRQLNTPELSHAGGALHR